MTPSQKILITGATGFIGRELLQQLVAKKHTDITALVRSQSQELPSEVAQIVINSNVNWVDTPFPEGVTTVIHLAGRAHVLKEISSSPLDLYRADNVEFTLSLARKALASGVKRFIFISSIGVNGPSTTNTPFDESSIPAPKADYAISKWEAEQGLRNLLKGSDMGLVIVRPPLVYAGHAPGNFRRLLKLVATGLPLPLASVDNCRSMVSLRNLVDFICLCIEHPAAANETFLISDGVDLSTPQIVERLAEGMGKRISLVPMPLGFMRWSAQVVGVRGAFEQLCGSLVVDSSKACNLLGWRAPVGADQALIKAGRDYKAMPKKDG
ncbi:NAD-dependent epimerase/dehydratase family protein [Pseudomonas frederiksbergensis]|uniref:NAD-dependent epimerase/dehydratase family protein n=1 Tax=Pseudomonas frederiksbergensis TaxID=104087 RepID=UPI003D05C4AD